MSEPTKSFRAPGGVELVPDRRGVVLNRDIDPMTTEMIAVIPWHTIEALLREREDQ